MVNLLDYVGTTEVVDATLIHQPVPLQLTSAEPTNVMYGRAVQRMSLVGKYDYRGEIVTESLERATSAREKLNVQLKVDFETLTAYIRISGLSGRNSIVRESFFSDYRVFSRSTGTEWTALPVNREDYEGLFRRNGALSLFDFENFDTSGMVVRNESGSTVFSHIYYRLGNRDDESRSYKVKLEVDNDSHLVSQVSFKGPRLARGRAAEVKVSFALGAVDDGVVINPPLELDFDD